MKSFYFTSENIGNTKGLIFTTESSQPKGSKIVPVIPNASQYIRDMNKYGLFGMGIRRVARLGPIKLVKIGLFGLPRAHKVLKKDFKSLLEVLLYVELQDFKKHRPKFVFLHPQITDLALANENKDILDTFIGLVKKSGSEPGLGTRNIGHLLKQAENWGLDISYFLSPFNNKGYLMNPSKKDCEDALKQKDKVLFADFSLPGMHIPNRSEKKYLESKGISAIILPG